MQLQQPKEKGFVLVVVLILMLFFAVVAQRFSRQLLINMAYNRGAVKNEQAKLLAYSGISIALLEMYKAENVDCGKDADENKKLQKLYAYILPRHHLWQEYKLDGKIDGLDGEISFAISSEDGKININKVYDFEKKQLIDDFKPILDKFFISKGEDEKKLTDYLVDFFENNKDKKIEDPSQLEPGEWFKVFYAPQPTEGNEVKYWDKKTAISDLFTVFGSQNGLNPILLSSSLRKALNFQKPEYKDKTEKKELFKELSDKISASFASNWSANFKYIEPIYLKKEGDSQENSTESSTNNESEKRKKTKGLSEIEKLLSNEIEPKFFSVLSFGKFKGVKQCILAIVEREKLKTNDKKAWNERQSFLTPPGYKIIRIYCGIDLI